MNGFDHSGDQLQFTVNLKKSGTYLLKIRYKTYGGDKPNVLKINGQKIPITFMKASNWTDVVVGQYPFNAGSNTLTIASSWGWIAVDCVTLTGGPGGPVTSVHLTAENPEP